MLFGFATLSFLGVVLMKICQVIADPMIHSSFRATYLTSIEQSSLIEKKDSYSFVMDNEYFMNGGTCFRRSGVPHSGHVNDRRLGKPYVRRRSRILSVFGHSGVEFQKRVAQALSAPCVSLSLPWPCFNSSRHFSFTVLAVFRVAKWRRRRV